MQIMMLSGLLLSLMSICVFALFLFPFLGVGGEGEGGSQGKFHVDEMSSSTYFQKGDDK